MRESEARFNNRRWRGDPGISEGRTLIEDADEAITRAARRTRYIRLEELIVLALAEADECGHAIVDVAVDLGVVFIAVVARELEDLIIAGTPAAGQWRQVAQDLRGKGRLWDLRARRVDNAGRGIHYGRRKDACAVVQRGERVDVDRFLEVAEAFVIGEEEELVLDDRTPNGQAKLISLQARLLERRRRRPKKIADGVELRIPKEVVSRAVKLIRSRAHHHVNHGPTDASVLRAVV